MLFKKKIALVLVIIFTVLWSCGQNADKNDSTVRRVISLSPNITETIYALGAENFLVGVSDFCNYPPRARQKTRVGGLINPNLERIIALKPDLLLATPASEDLAAQLAQRNIRAVLLPNDRLQDIFATIDTLGRLFDLSRRAEKLTKTIRDSLEIFRRLAQQLPHASPEALFVLHRDPGTTRNISVIGGNTFTDDLWRMLGGRNAFESAGLKYGQLNSESLLTMNPDLIIEFKFNQKWDEQRRRNNKKEWQNLKQLKAVKEGHIYVIDGNYSLIPGPRVTLLIRDYYQILRDYNNQRLK